MRIAVLIATGLIVISGMANAEIYKWRDANGVLHFSDTPVADQKMEVFVPPPGTISESVEVGDKVPVSSYESARENPPAAQSAEPAHANRSMPQPESKKMSEEEERARLKEMFEKERNRPKSPAETRKAIQERKRQQGEMRRRAGIY